MFSKIIPVVVLIGSVVAKSQNDSCVHGEYRCTDVSSDRCNFGTWVASMCPEKTKCIGYGDYECVAVNEFKSLEKKLSAFYKSSHHNVSSDTSSDTSSETNCTHGEFRCTDKSTDRCNFGTWVAAPCVEGTKCLGCGDFECVAEAEYPALRDKLCSTFQLPVVNETCFHGDFRCTHNSTDRCDHGVWFVNPCAVGTKCLGCGDYECVAEAEYPALRDKLCPLFTAVKEDKPCVNQVEKCNHGDFRCTNNSTDRCNWGEWISHPCATGTKCLACGDYECVFESQFDDLSKKLCVGQYADESVGKVSSASSLEMSVFLFMGFIAALLI